MFWLRIKEIMEYGRREMELSITTLVSPQVMGITAYSVSSHVLQFCDGLYLI